MRETLLTLKCVYSKHIQDPKLGFTFCSGFPAQVWRHCETYPCTIAWLGFVQGFTNQCCLLTHTNGRTAKYSFKDWACEYLDLSCEFLWLVLKYWFSLEAEETLQVTTQYCGALSQQCPWETYYLRKQFAISVGLFTSHFTIIIIVIIFLNPNSKLLVPQLLTLHNESSLSSWFQSSRKEWKSEPKYRSLPCQFICVL